MNYNSNPKLVVTLYHSTSVSLDILIFIIYNYTFCKYKKSERI